MTNPPAHSLIGASSMSRLIACPASLNLSRQVDGGGGSSIHAATGTVAHKLGEDALTLSYDPRREVGTVITVDGHDVAVTEDMAAAVQVYIDEVRGRFAGAAWTALETRVCLDPYWPADDQPPVSAFGTADAAAYHPGRQHLDVIDYKNGAGVFVDVTDNPQLLYYAAGLLLRVPGSVVTVDLVIVQPNVRGQDKVRVCRTTALDVLMWVEDTLRPTVREATQPGARLSAGSHCKFCPGRGACPALATLAQDLARRDFGPSPAEAVILDDGELGAVLTDADLTSPYLDALRDKALEAIQKGAHVPGWQVVPSRPVRSWTVPAAELLALSPRLAAPLSVLSPAQAERVLDPAEWVTVEPFIQSKSSGVRLAPAPADPQATRSTAQDDFA